MKKTKDKITTRTSLLGRRTAPNDIAKEVGFIRNLYQKAVMKFTAGIPLLILNRNRQIIFANDDFFQLVGALPKKEIYGLRPGEALHCENADKTSGGCGTSEHCKDCGTLLSILAGLKGEEMSAECRLTRNGCHEASDYLVHCAPIDMNGEIFVAMSIKDISDVKRREVLERIFLHDVLNTAGGIQGLSSLLLYRPEKNRKRAIEMIYQASTELVEEIQGQKQLLCAEKGDLHCIAAETTTTALLEKQIALYTNHSITKKKTVVLSPEAEDIPIKIDTSLLGRVIGNMIKNAIEASEPEGAVSVTCSALDPSHVEFSVHNATFIPKKDQLHIFQRSFSTKGKGRGIGTYCIRLLTENYLYGKVSFTSSEDKGSTFYAVIPRTPPTNQ